METVVRIEFARVVATLTRLVGGDVGLGEELAQDAVVAALEQWPVDGVPANPAGWLTTVARRRAVDQFRRNALAGRKYQELAREVPEVDEPDFDAGVDDRIDDDLLRLVFIACHPVLPMPARVGLTLRLVGGLTASEIARAHLQPEATVAQRLTRARKTLARERPAFEVPTGAERTARLGSVLQVIYLMFNEGYSATAGPDWTRPGLCAEAIRLGRLLRVLMPAEAEVHGLAALMELQAARLPARQDATGAPVLLEDQDRRRWDRLLISRGLSALDRARTLSPDAPGPYHLQAEIAACHSVAFSVAETDWTRVAALYTALAEQTGNPVVALNRAVAIAMADGPHAGLAAVDELAATGALAAYHLLPSVRGDLLTRIGRFAAAASEFDRAARLTTNEAERTLLRRRWQEAQQAAEDDVDGDSIS